MSKSKVSSFDYLYLILIIAITVVMGICFGNSLIVHEYFVNIDDVKNSVKKAQTVDDVKKVGIKLLRQSKRKTDNFVGGMKDSVLGSLGLGM
jgi:hypothetical protein